MTGININDKLKRGDKNDWAMYSECRYGDHPYAVLKQNPSGQSGRKTQEKPGE